MERQYTEEEARQLTYAWLDAQRFDTRQDDNGIDLQHLRSNLELTPTERLEKHRQALNVVMEVRRAAYDAGLRRNP